MGFAVKQRSVTAADMIAGLKDCSKSRDLKRGQHIHRQVMESGLDSNIAVLNTLVHMYCKCGSLHLAVELFESMRHRDNVTWNCLIMGYVEKEQHTIALELLNRMDCRPSHVTYVAGLKACIGLASGSLTVEKLAALERGTELHRQLKKLSFERNIVVASTLVTLYSKCGSMHRAKEVFDGMAEKNVVAWTSLIQGYVENSEHSRALEAFYSMNCEPSEVSFVAAVKACRGLASEVNACSNSSPEQRDMVVKDGLALHERIKMLGFDANVRVGNILIDMYSKCREMELARSTFEGMIRKSVVTWNTLMLGYVENGENEIALELYGFMDCNPDDVTYVAVFKALSSIGNKRVAERETILERAMAVQRSAKAGERGFGAKAWNSLMELCAKCGNMDLARNVFEGMTNRDVIAWNCLAQGYVENGEPLEALKLLETMDCEASQVSYAIQLKSYIVLAHEESEKERILEKVIDIHKRVTEQRLDTTAALASALMEVYSKCNKMSLARDVFERVIKKNVVHWTQLILGYVENGVASTALQLFLTMDCEPDEVVFLAAIKACSELATTRTVSEADRVVEQSVRVHEEIKASGFESSLVVTNALVDMYRKLRDMGAARDVFERMEVKSVVSWNALILGYVENGEFLVALDLFRRMNCEPTDATIIAALKAYSGLADERSGDSEREKLLEESLEIYDRLPHPEISLSNTLLNVCNKCGSMRQAKKVFDTMERKDVVSWNCLILGYVENGESTQAMEMFSAMDCRPDAVSFVAVLKACQSLAALSAGRLVHGTVCKLGLEEESMVANTLVDFYGSSGCMSTAAEIFNCLHSPSIVSWNALLTGYSALGDSGQVLSLTQIIMQPANLRLNAVSFVCILTACSHTARVEEGRRWFESMQRLEIPRSIEHYNCMVDMFARANRFEEALLTIENMPLKANEVTWMSLLGASRKWNNLEVGELALESLQLKLPDESMCNHKP